MVDAEGVVTLDAHLGGQPVALLGIESRPLPRRGRVPVDGPTTFTAGTLFPRSSKKAARSINAASGNRPLVVLANLSGFDGSPESLRQLQLEYGAEIGRAIVNFEGPIVFCVVSRYHGGAFVVFSGDAQRGHGGRRGRGLLRVGDRRGARRGRGVRGRGEQAHGGRPAGRRTWRRGSPRRRAADRRARRRGSPPSWRRCGRAVRSEKLGEVADEFDTAHSVQRAQRVGSVDEIVAPTRLRPYLVDAVRRGMAR